MLKLLLGSCIVRSIEKLTLDFIMFIHLTHFIMNIKVLRANNRKEIDVHIHICINNHFFP